MQRGHADFSEFEEKLMRAILGTSNFDEISKIVKQYDVSRVVERKFTGVGFFTYFSVENLSLHLSNDVNMTLGAIQTDMEGLKWGMGSVLFIRDGVIYMLEGYTYGEAFPEEIVNYRFFLAQKDGSLVELA